MLDSKEFDVDDFYDDFEMHDHKHDKANNSIMSPGNIGFAVGTVVIVALVLGCCCRRRKQRGQVLSSAVGGVVPPAPPAPPGPAPYPQQQYTPAAYAASIVATYPTQSASPYPVAAYPNAVPYPTVGGAYPTAGAPYPVVGAPYPATGAPYPPAGPPYPAAPSAPDANVLPPSYEQAVGGSHPQAPYNPQAPR